MDPRGRTTPLRSEGSFNEGRALHTPPRPITSEYDNLSPINFRQSGHDSHSSPFFDRDLRPYSTTPQYKDHISICSTDDNPNLLSTPFQAAPRNLFGPDSFTGRPTTREDRLRLLRQDALNHNLPGTSSFIGEKLMVTTEEVNDIYNMASVYYQQQQFERALAILNKKDTLNKSVKCRYLAALCSISLENGRDALDYLGHSNPFSGKDVFHDETMDGCIKLESVMCFARGKAYLLIKEIDNARDCFKEALNIDVKCYDALEALVQYNMMEEKAEWEFVMTLPFEEHCGIDSDYFRYLYGLKLKRDILNGKRMDNDVEDIAKSLDVQLSTAEGYFDEGRYEECLKICKAIKEQDAFFKQSIPVYLSCLYELDMKIELYEYAQELVDRLNDEAVAWHAVGLYYLHVKKNLEARKYFTIALKNNRFFQQSWLGYGHSFSAEKDHEQAISAYLQCSRLIPGSYLPLMNIAMEYMEQNNLPLAYDYFEKSLQKNTTDPFLHNEVAVYYYKKEMYKKCQEHLHIALKLSKKSLSFRSSIWEKIWCNLGHVYRHEPLQDYDRALRCFENALVRNPKNSDARATVGMIYQLQGRTAKAITEYLEALNNTDSVELINDLLETSLKSHAQINYATAKDISLNDGFDVIEAGNYFNEAKDEIDRELAERAESNTHSRMPSTNDFITSEDAPRQNMTRGWL
ncbi:unnamed protein product [Mucor hiemalis]